jgi:ABC-type transport system involved in multi-copper enzyme maturation permease subunit
MIRILAVTGMTLRRLVRNRLLGLSLVVTLLVLGMQTAVITHALRLRGAGRLDEAADALAGVFPPTLSLMAFFAQLIAMVIGASVVRRDVIDGTVASVLARPISRAEYLAGSVLGSVAYLVVLWVTFALMLAAAFLAFGQALGAVHVVAMAVRLLSCVLCFSIALAFAMRFNPWVAGVATILVLTGPGIVGGVLDLADQWLHIDVPQRVRDALAMPFPLTSTLDPAREALYSGSLSPRPLWPGLLHVADYAAVAALAAYGLFRRLELNRLRD